MLTAVDQNNADQAKKLVRDRDLTLREKLSIFDKIINEKDESPPRLSILKILSCVCSPFSCEPNKGKT